MTITDTDRQRLLDIFQRPFRRDFTALVEWAYAREQSGGVGATYNVKTYGAKGDGSDDTVPISVANLLAKNAGGGTVFFPKGTYATQKITVYNRVTYQGEGAGVSIILLKAGETTNVLEGENFSTLTGTSSNQGPVQFQIRNLSVDGNKVNCPAAGRGIAVYGDEFRIYDVHVRNCVSDGFFLEFRGDSSTTFDSNVDFEESFMSHCKAMHNGGNGFWIFGVHDSVITFCNAGFNGGGAGSATGGFRAEGNGNHWVHCHSYGTQADYAWNLRGHNLLVGCVGEGARTSQLFCAFNDVHWIGGELYFAGQAGATAISFGTTSNRIIIDGVHIFQGGTTDVFAPAIDFTNVDAQLVLKATVDQPSGTAYSGAVPADALVEIIVGGGSTTPNFYQRPGDAAAPVKIEDRLYLPPAVRDEFLLADGTQPDTTKWTRTLGAGTGTALAVQALKARFTTGNTGTFSVNDDVTIESILAASLIKDAELVFASVVGTINAQSFLYAGMRSANKAPVRATDSYFVEVSVTASGVIRFFVIKRVSSAQTTLYDSTNQAVQVAGNKFWHRFRVKGTSIKYKWWADGAVEPLAWHLDTTDTGVAGAGIVSFNAGGGSPAGNNAYQEIDNVALFAL